MQSRTEHYAENQRTTQEELVNHPGEAGNPQHQKYRYKNNSPENNQMEVLPKRPPEGEDSTRHGQYVQTAEQ